jgi:ribulose-5-phosphate 4-epimerase/fuculose-1-phosphate aldolase
MAGLSPVLAPSNCSEEEWSARVELAATYRLFHALGWHELIYNHITVRVPGTHDKFLINPFGLMYREICASNLVKVDICGNVIGTSGHGINPAGFVVHSTIHRARPDVHCVMHTHTPSGVAVACRRDRLPHFSFPATFYTDRIAYQDSADFTLDVGERNRLAASLGRWNVMILRNHGLLACGRSVAQVFAELYHLQRACEIQLAVQANGATIIEPPHEAAARVADQFDQIARGGEQNDLMFAQLIRWMDELDGSYRS